MIDNNKLTFHERGQKMISTGWGGGVRSFSSPFGRFFFALAPSFFALLKTYCAPEEGNSVQPPAVGWTALARQGFRGFPSPKSGTLCTRPAECFGLIA
jgi:hypothetical protein